MNWQAANNQGKTNLNEMAILQILISKKLHDRLQNADIMLKYILKGADVSRYSKFICGSWVVSTVLYFVTSGKNSLHTRQSWDNIFYEETIAHQRYNNLVSQLTNEISLQVIQAKDYSTIHK